MSAPTSVWRSEVESFFSSDLGSRLAPSDQHRLGFTKVFLLPSAMDAIQTAVHRLLSGSAARIQNAFRAFALRQRFQRMKVRGCPLPSG